MFWADMARALQTRRLDMRSCRRFVSVGRSRRSLVRDGRERRRMRPLRAAKVVRKGVSWVDSKEALGDVSCDSCVASAAAFLYLANYKCFYGG